jgi:oligopeptide/dipeptide ABC transporter ATP-binding protein
MPLLELDQIHARYRQGAQAIAAVNGVSLALDAGKTLAVVGESGCGKSTLGRVAIRLQDPDAGTIRFDGQDVTRLGQGALRPLRARMQMVFQDAAAALNPRHRVGTILARPLALHGVPRAARRDRAVQVLEDVGLDAGALERWPREFSGGQRQRLGIARALLLKPRLLVCDEPVSALDVSVQAKVLNLLSDLQRRDGLAYLFISHDLGVVRHVASQVAVMYLGRIVEQGDAAALWAAPRHPYTRLLIDATPGHGARAALEGDVPPRGLTVAGCAFHPRCPRASALCAAVAPERTDVAGDTGHDVACHHPLAPGERAA